MKPPVDEKGVSSHSVLCRAVSIYLNSQFDIDHSYNEPPSATSWYKNIIFTLMKNGVCIHHLKSDIKFLRCFSIIL